MTSSSRIRILGAAAAIFALLACVPAQGAETGYPLITLLRQEQHQGGSQTFDVARDERGRLYFANLEGVLLYDGAWWSRADVPGETAFRVEPGSDGSVAVTVVDGFGVLRRGASGSMKYHSLVEQLPPHLRKDIGQSQVCAESSGFVFAATRFVARWDGRTMQVLSQHEPDARTPRCFVTGKKSWIARVSGLEELGGPARFPKKRVDLVLPDLVVVRGEGMFHLDENPYTTDASAWLRGKIVMDGRVLRDGRIAIATLRDGLLILTRDHRISQVIGTGSGLPDDFLYSVVEDHEGALWLGLDGAIARVDVGMPMTILDNRIGLRGGIHSVTRHGATLMAGTPHGVYAIEETTTGARARRIDGLDEVPWSMSSHSGDLLVGTSDGVYSVRDGSAPQKIAGTAGHLVYVMAPSRRDPSMLWLGTENGVGQLVRRANVWHFQGPLAGTAHHIRSLVEVDGVLWAGSDIEGLTRIDMDGRVRRFGGGTVSVLIANGRVVFVHKHAFVQLTPEGLFVPDPILGHVNAPGGFDYAIADRDGHVWLDSRPPRVVRLRGHRYERDAHAVGVMAGDIEHFFPEASGVMWLGSDRGLYRVAPAAIAVPELQPAPIIHRAMIGNKGLEIEASGRGSESALPHDFGRLRVEVAPLSYRPATAFQYRLDPIDGGWTPWTHQAFLDFTTLAPGRYTFRVRTRAAVGGVSGEGRWSFVVDPPWYLTWWAMVLWAVTAAAIVAAIIRIRTQRLQRRTGRLQELIDQQTVALRIANSRLEQANTTLEKLSLADALTGVANRRYFDRALSDEWERATRRGEPLSLLLADLDHFKILNDTRGHKAGDEYLRRVAQYLQGALRGADDLVARWGGEEFAILLPGSDEEAAAITAERLRDGIERHGVTASFGVAALAGDPDTQSLFERADRALYAAKRAGRNRVHIESAEWSEDATA